jgi:hypothetical protein
MWLNFDFHCREDLDSGFLIMALCNLVGGYQHHREIYCVQIEAADLSTALCGNIMQKSRIQFFGVLKSSL